ncbi:Succinyl-CoA synthetase, alpha subunit-related enzymes [hydrothermal vent metagenome]|uniref:Succinyl-CoA synthetase, alpha subunit-related enzymes n=1 Tax=hydrothermal vent metagenome TaxID=652676 RepID=A0A3B0STD1_9ZZZZ
MTDQFLRDILTSVKSIALVGASKNPERPSNKVMKFLIGQGYDLYPVNPGLAGSELMGRKVYASLSDIPADIDMVDIFRSPDTVGPIVDEAIAKNAKVVWMQLGVINEDAAEKAKQAGLKVVMNHCPAIEIPRLGLEKG